MGDYDVIDTFHASCNVDAPKGAALLFVLIKHENGDYQAYQGIVTLPEMITWDEFRRKEDRKKAALRVTGLGAKLSHAVACDRWPWLKDELYRT